MSHHGNDSQAASLLREAMLDLMGEYPNGRLNADDAGALAVAIGHNDKAVTIQFPKSVTWIGFTPEQAVQIAESLIEHARKVGFTKPVSFTIGN